MSIPFSCHEIWKTSFDYTNIIISKQPCQKRYLPWRWPLYGMIIVLFFQPGDSPLVGKASFLRSTFYHFAMPVRNWHSLANLLSEICSGALALLQIFVHVASSPECLLTSNASGSAKEHINIFWKLDFFRCNIFVEFLLCFTFTSNKCCGIGSFGIFPYPFKNRSALQLLTITVVEIWRGWWLRLLAQLACAVKGK